MESQRDLMEQPQRGVQGERKLTLGQWIRKSMTALAPWKEGDENNPIVLAPTIDELRRRRARNRTFVAIGLVLGLIVITAGIAYVAWRFL